jgi:endonuclease/exonuclease/phosphatase family metal-dependent hydrolase
MKYEADIYVVQECENPTCISKKSSAYQLFSQNILWTGKNKHRGLGVFAKSNISLEKLTWNHLHRGRDVQWFLPVRIQNQFNIVAVWNHHADAEAFPYIGQFWLFLQNNKTAFRNCIICGDFNSNSIWDKWDRWWNHSDCVKELSELGIRSVYHQMNSIEHGSEPQKTFFLYRHPQKSYHIDYIFAPLDIISNESNHLEYGIFDEWKNVSDHVPILWDWQERTAINKT